MKTALITGATGLVGKELVRQLLAHPAYEKVFVLSRRTLDLQHPKLKEIIIDFDQLEEVNLEEKVDDCFCALGTTLKKAGKEGQLKVDYQYVVETAKLGSRHEASNFLVVSSQGANYNSRFFYMRTKGQMEEAVKRVNYPAIYLVRPSLIVGKRDENRTAEKLGSYLYKLLGPLMIGKLKKMKPVSGEQIAKCMIILAQQKESGKFTIESDVIQTY